MGLYGMTSGQALGQGTFTFDRIVPNRYLLDSRVNNDSVMPGRYALIEYDRPVAVIDDINNFTYEEGSKTYDIIPVKDGVIDIAEGVDCIFVCVVDANNNSLYQYYYYNLSDGNIALYASPMTPNEFNKIVDKAYIAKDKTDNIYLDTSDLWDSTAWIKIIDKEKSEFKYIKIADLNVLAPSFNVLNFDDEVSEPLPINTFYFDEDNNAIFNAPQYKPSDEQRGTFNVRYPYPLDLNMQVDIDYSGNRDTSSWVESQYQEDDEIEGEGHIKLFTLHLPIIGETVNDMDLTTLEAQQAIGETRGVKAVTEDVYNKAFNLIKYPRSSAKIWPTTGNIPTQSEIVNNNLPSGAGPIWEAIKAAYTASSSDQAGLINRIGTDGITVSIGNQTKLDNGKLNIEVTVNSNNLITASKINEMWN